MAWYWPFSKKEEPKKQRAFAGAMYNRLVTDWISSGTSADSEIKGSLRALRNRARQLERDNDFIRQYLRAVQNNVIGQGIPFQAQVRMQRGNKLNEPMNDQIEKAWARWARKDSCHVAGKLSFSDIERLAIRSIARDGEVFVRVVNQKFGSSRIPFALEVIEADLLDDDKNGQSEEGNEIRMGIEFSKWGRPLYYYFHKKHPGDFQFPKANQVASNGHNKVPASEVIHLFIQERAHQTRGFSWIASSMMRLHQLQGFEEATVIKARVAAATMGFITSPEGELKGDDVDGYDRVQDSSPGQWNYLAPGEAVNVPDMGEPPATLDQFMTSNLRAIAAGSGVSYETISRDYSRTNYSSSRLALLDDRDHWRVLQRWVIDNFHQIVFEKWLDMAVLEGAIQLAGYELAPEKFQAVRWMPRGWAWVDPLKEVQGAKEALRANLTTQSDILAGQGLDFEEVMMQRKREKDLAEELGLEDDLIDKSTQGVQEDTQDVTENQS